MTNEVAFYLLSGGCVLCVLLVNFLVPTGHRKLVIFFCALGVALGVAGIAFALSVLLKGVP